MSTLNGYGNLKVKRLEVADQIISHGTSSDDYELTMSFANQSADRTLTFPALSGNQSILHDGSSIAATQLDINGAGAASGGAADADLIVIYDDSASANKKITLAQLDSYIGHNAHADDSITTAMIQDDAITAAKLASNAVVNASVAANAAIDFSKLAALADAKLLVGNGSNVATAVSLSGDATLANNGALTIANDAITTAKVADDAITNALIATNAVNADSCGVSAGTISASKCVVADSSKDITGGRHFTITGNSQAVAFNVGGADSWRIRVNSGNLELQKHDGSSYITKQVFTG